MCEATTFSLLKTPKNQQTNKNPKHHKQKKPKQTTNRNQKTHPQRTTFEFWDSHCMCAMRNTVHHLPHLLALLHRHLLTQSSIFHIVNILFSTESAPYHLLPVTSMQLSFPVHQLSRLNLSCCRTATSHTHNTPPNLAKASTLVHDMLLWKVLFGTENCSMDWNSLCRVDSRGG